MRKVIHARRRWCPAIVVASALGLAAGCAAPTTGGPTDATDVPEDATDGSTAHPLECDAGTVTVRIACPMGSIGHCEGGTSSVSVDDAGAVAYRCCGTDVPTTQTAIPAACQASPTCECLSQVFFGDPRFASCNGCEVSVLLP